MEDNSVIDDTTVILVFFLRNHQTDNNNNSNIKGSINFMDSGNNQGKNSNKIHYEWYENNTRIEATIN